MDLDSAMNTCQSFQSASSQTGVLCGSLISALDDREEAVETAASLPDFWKNIPNYEQYVLLQPVETRVCKALLMLSCSKAYHWVASITTAAVKSRTSPNSWVYQLARDVETEWQYRNNNPNHSKDAVFHSKDYLPSLATPCDAKVVLRRWGMIDRDQEELKIIQTVCSIIETWLQFPTSKDNKSNDKLKCTLISIITKYMPLSVLLLDAIWSMFVKPYQLLIHGRSKQRISLPHTVKTVKLFEELIQKHSMNNPASKEYLLLTVLTERSGTWFNSITSDVPMETQQIAPVYNQVRSILPSWIIFF